MSDSVRTMSFSAPPSPARQTTYSGTPSNGRAPLWVAARLSRWPDLSRQPGDEQLAEQVDEAAAADAHGRSVVDGAERRLQVASSMNTSSMAPGEARMPSRTPPPSKAGPAEQAHESSQSLLPSTISPLVPMSMNSVSLSVSYMPRRDDAGGDVAAHVAAHGRQDVHAGEHVGGRAQAPRRPAWARGLMVGMYGSSRRYRGSTPRSRWIIVVLPATVTSWISCSSTPLRPLELVEQVVDGLDGQRLQPLEAVLALGVDDAADHVLAAGDLLVVGAGGVDDAAASGSRPGRRPPRWCRGRRRGPCSPAGTRRGRRGAGAAAGSVPYTQSRISSATRDLPVGRGADAVPSCRSSGSSARTSSMPCCCVQRPSQAVEVRRLVGERRRLDVQREQCARRGSAGSRR